MTNQVLCQPALEFGNPKECLEKDALIAIGRRGESRNTGAAPG